jgi:hypothetical protein
MGQSSAKDTNAIAQYLKAVSLDKNYDWKCPINFYGKVVDASNAPVAQADVQLSWTDLSTEGTTKSTTTSDENGLFSLLDKTGKHLLVHVSKNGYYTPPSESLWGFEYASPFDGLFTPDPLHPIVFHLRKKGEGSFLITSQLGLKLDFPITIPRDGTPTRIDLLQRAISSSGQLELRQFKPNEKTWRDATYWSFEMVIPDGGFAEQHDEFPFEAPEIGYQPFIRFEYKKAEGLWAEGVSNNYYIKFGNPAKYGRLKIVTDISMGGAILTYAINPDGTRNLESK